MNKVLQEYGYLVSGCRKHPDLIDAASAHEVLALVAEIERLEYLLTRAGGERCCECGSALGIGFHINDDIWQKIAPGSDAAPDGGPDGWGILCPWCADAKLKGLGYNTVPTTFFLTFDVLRDSREPYECAWEQRALKAEAEIERLEALIEKRDNAAQLAEAGVDSLMESCEYWRRHSMTLAKQLVECRERYTSTQDALGEIEEENGELRKRMSDPSWPPCGSQAENSALHKQVRVLEKEVLGYREACAALRYRLAEIEDENRDLRQRLSAAGAATPGEEGQ